MYRWLEVFRAKAPPKSTDAYRTAALVVPDVVSIQILEADDDLEAPPVMVRVQDPAIGPDGIDYPPFRVQAIKLIAALAVMLMLCIMLFGMRP